MHTRHALAGVVALALGANALTDCQKEITKIINAWYENSELTLQCKCFCPLS